MKKMKSDEAQSDTVSHGPVQRGGIFGVVGNGAIMLNHQDDDMLPVDYTQMVQGSKYVYYHCPGCGDTI